MTEYEVCQQNTMACEQEIAKGIIGQKDVIRQVMLALLAGGNVLLEGMPGLGKTMLVRRSSAALRTGWTAPGTALLSKTTALPLL